jgi:hypothetical protein
MTIHSTPDELRSFVHLLREREAFIDEHREELRAQIAEGVLQAECGELVDGEAAMERLRRDLDDRFGEG